ncbi:MAG: mycothione reductase [Actinomycetota bacterium]|nr:mycothione reductase [Actinomycetota bacterium]
MLDNVEEFDLVIVGTGSGNAIPSPELDDWRIALVERDVFGGTCLNRGCIPSKILVHTADVAETVRHASRYGLGATLEQVAWPDIVERVFGRIDPIAAGGERYRDKDCDNITVLRGDARFIGDRVLEVGERRITGHQFILAAGARPYVPPIRGLADVPFHTSDTIMRIEAVPERMAVIGGGYIAAELGHVFGGLGAHVSFLLRGDRMLRNEDDDVSIRATELYRDRFDVITHTTGLEITHDGRNFEITGESDQGPVSLTVDTLLVAAGRHPNGDQLDVVATGVHTQDSRVITDDTLATNVEGIWALGDLTNDLQLKHLANLEAKIVFHNVQHPDDRRTIDRSMVPHAVFGSPQIASVGHTEREARAQRIPHRVATKDYGSTAYGWALEDDSGFVKLIAHAEDHRLIGAHVIGPQASTLIQPLVQAMRFGQTVGQLAHDVWYIHPALTEVIENALIDLDAELNG